MALLSSPDTASLAPISPAAHAAKEHREYLFWISLHLPYPSSAGTAEPGSVHSPQVTAALPAPKAAETLTSQQQKHPQPRLPPSSALHALQAPQQGHQPAAEPSNKPFPKTLPAACTDASKAAGSFTRSSSRAEGAVLPLNSCPTAQKPVPDITPSAEPAWQRKKWLHARALALVSSALTRSARTQPAQQLLLILSYLKRPIFKYPLYNTTIKSRAWSSLLYYPKTTFLLMIKGHK